MPLQKSFSEQNVSSRNQQTWHRSKTHSGAQNTTRPTPTRPLQPVSEASKNKLNAFEFHAPVQNCDSAQDAGNKDGAEGHPAKRTKQPVFEDGQTAAEPAAMTPHNGRLVWQELIGVSEEKEEEVDVSPNERIIWESKRRDGVPDISPMLARRRGKKRARSSSPVSSPSSHSKPATPAVDVKRLTQALKSAHADPSLDLWDRFTLSRAGNATPNGATHPTIAQIMVSSSPQPARTGPEGTKISGTQSGSGLRRAVSAGFDFSKRRKIERGRYVAQSSLAIDGSPSQNTKTSMVNDLLNSVNGEINRSKAIQARHDAEKSPSPKEQRQNLQASNTSSIQGESPPPRPPPPLFKQPSRAHTKEENSQRLKTPEKASSDYGDDDFDDDDALMVLDASLAPRAEESASTILAPHTKPTVQTEITPTYPVSSDDDEFGDMDDDVFAAAEDLIADMDSSHTSHMTSGKTADNHVAVQQPIVINKQQRPGVDTYDDDAFGDDFDFEAAEISATQAVKHTSSVAGSVSPVGD